MADRPILFSAPMVRALLDGRKTQTRRLLGQFDVFRRDDGSEAPVSCLQIEGEPLPRVTIGNVVTLKTLKAAVGDRMWVRESYFQYGHWEPIDGARTKGGRQKWGFVPDLPQILFDPPQAYRKGMHSAAPATPAWHKRLGRFMPRKASRMTLIVTDVRVQRLQEISEEDARAEGAELDQALLAGGLKATYRGGFARIWAGIHEPHPNNPTSWGNNPWVAAYSFTVEHRNIDASLSEVDHG
jgi:hypothetical protein